MKKKKILTPQQFEIFLCMKTESVMFLRSDIEKKIAEVKVSIDNPLFLVLLLLLSFIVANIFIQKILKRKS